MRNLVAVKLPVCFLGVICWFG